MKPPPDRISGAYQRWREALPECILLHQQSDGALFFGMDLGHGFQLVTAGTTDMEEAERDLPAFQELAALLEPSWPPPPAITFAELASHWLRIEGRWVTDRRKREVMQAYQEDLFVLGPRRLDELQTGHLQRVLDALAQQKTRTPVTRAFRTLIRLYTWAHACRFVWSMPRFDLPPPKTKARPDSLPLRTPYHSISDVLPYWMPSGPVGQGLLGIPGLQGPDGDPDADGGRS